MVQHMGVETRDAWHKIDWAAVGENSALVELPRPQWIFGHDSQQYAYDEFDKAMNLLERGVEYEPFNIPPKEINHRSRDFRTDQVITSKGAAAQSARETQLGVTA